MLSGKLSTVLAVYSITSLVAFLVYAVDKSAARSGRWRIRESALLLFGLVGGWPGALLAQKTLRPRSAKPSFQTAFWASVVANCCGLLLYASSGGSRTLLSLLRVAS